MLPFGLPSPVSAQTSKRIEVNLTTQRLLAYDGQQLVYNFPISSGKSKTPTVTGTFYPWAKLYSDRMVGGSRLDGTYYNLPKVPYVMYFYQGYAIHGTYWHNNFGHPMSHGCVNLSIPNARLLFYWTAKNTPITIYGQTPSS